MAGVGGTVLTGLNDVIGDHLGAHRHERLIGIGAANAGRVEHRVGSSRGGGGGQGHLPAPLNGVIVFAEDQGGAGQHLGAAGHDGRPNQVVEIVVGVGGGRIQRRRCAGGIHGLNGICRGRTTRRGCGVVDLRRLGGLIATGNGLHPSSRGGQPVVEGADQAPLVIDDEVVAVAEREAVLDGRFVFQGHVEDLHRQGHLPLPQIDLSQVVLRHGHHLGIPHQGDGLQARVGGAAQSPEGAGCGAVGLRGGDRLALGLLHRVTTGHLVGLGLPLGDGVGDQVHLGHAGTEAGQVVGR